LMMIVMFIPEFVMHIPERNGDGRSDAENAHVRHQHSINQAHA
jgi:hypothetical protein